MNILKDKRILVTGASGFIGTALTNALTELGAIVGVTEHKTEVSAVCYEVYPCDLNSDINIFEVVNHFQPEIVFHLASQAIVTDGNINPMTTYKTNIMGSVNLFSSLLTVEELHGVIVASTDKVYGRQEDLPYKENFPLYGTKQIYETSKTCEDIIAQSYYHTYGLPIAITRFGNVYGPNDFHWSRIIPGTIWKFLENKTPVIRSNGQHYRDFIYIDDVVNGYIELAKHRISKQSIEPMIYNFGTGIPSIVLDVVAMISEYFPDAKPPEIMYSAQDEIHQQYLDCEKAKQNLGWKPETKLREGIAKTVEWYKEFYVFSN